MSEEKLMFASHAFEARAISHSDLLDIERGEDSYLFDSFYQAHKYLIGELAANLTAERDAALARETELVAQVSRMQTFIRMSATKWMGVPEVEPTFLNLLRVANQQPEDALRDIQAEAVEKYYYMGWEHSLSTKADDGDHYSCGKRLAKEFAERVKAGEV